MRAASGTSKKKNLNHWQLATRSMKATGSHLIHGHALRLCALALAVAALEIVEHDAHAHPALEQQRDERREKTRLASTEESRHQKQWNHGRGLNTVEQRGVRGHRRAPHEPTEAGILEG